MSLAEQMAFGPLSDSEGTPKAKRTTEVNGGKKVEPPHVSHNQNRLALTWSTPKTIQIIKKQLSASIYGCNLALTNLHLTGF